MSLVASVSDRTAEIVETLSVLDDDALAAPSELPGWSRLTIACHLRFGADAFARMTRGGIEGVPVAYYPAGRDAQRPSTLLPQPGESGRDVVASLASHSEDLHGLWIGLSEDDWQREVTEPADQPDLGPLRLDALPLLRLTEVEVHGSDLGLGLTDWSDEFVTAALPFRLDWLNTRRTNHRDVDGQVKGPWLLTSTDSPLTYRVTVSGSTVDSRPAASDSTADAVIEGSSRDLLALLLGRPVNTPLRYAGDIGLAKAFSRAFPGP